MINKPAHLKVYWRT